MNNFHMGWSKQQLCLFLCLFLSLCTFQKNSLTSLLGKGEKLDSSANLYLSSVGSQPNSCASPPIFIILMGGCAGVAPASLLGGIWVEKSITVEGERCGQLTQAVMLSYRRWSETFWVKVLMVAHRCLFKKIFLTNWCDTKMKSWVHGASPLLPLPPHQPLLPAPRLPPAGSTKWYCLSITSAKTWYFMSDGWEEAHLAAQLDFKDKLYPHSLRTETAQYMEILRSRGSSSTTAVIQ